MHDAILFDDGQGALAPLADLRPAFAIRTGALTTRARLTRSLNLTLRALWVRPEHVAMARSRHNEAPINIIPAGSADTLLLNGRCVIPPPELPHLSPGQALLEPGSGHVIAMRCAPAHLTAALAAGTWPTPASTLTAAAPCLLHRPWHVRTFRDAAILHDLQLLHAQLGPTLAPAHALVFGTHPLSIAPSAKVYPGVTLDLESGPIVIDEHATIRPGVTLIGPCYVGPHSTILDKALIKANTAIGDHCKVAGEVGGTIFHGFSNKAHDGHLGDSWIGKWSNLGAGTTNSNLLNTYAEVTMRATPSSPIERTGQQFMGCIIGDHVKTAICTRIMTGCIIHTGAMLAMSQPASGTIQAFTWGTDDTPPGGDMKKFFRLDKFLDIARAVMARRKLTPGPEYIAALSSLHAAATR